MKIPIKKNTEFIPICFENISDNIIYIDRNIRNNYKSIKDLINLNKCHSFEGTSTQYEYFYNRRTNTMLYLGKGFILSGNSNILILLFTKKNDEIFVFLNATYLENHTTIHTSIKQQLKTLGVDKKHIIYQVESLMWNKFQEPLEITMDDYNSELQSIISNDFYKYTKTLSDEQLITLDC